MDDTKCISFVVLGDALVGKSQYCFSVEEGRIPDEYEGVKFVRELYEKKLTINETQYLVLLFDNGEKKEVGVFFEEKLTNSDVKGAIILYSVTSQNSFDVAERIGNRVQNPICQVCTLQ